MYVDQTIRHKNCDFCDDQREAKMRCEICGKYGCMECGVSYSQGNRLYWFCNTHWGMVARVLEYTDITIDELLDRLRNKSFLKDMDGRGVY